MWRDHDLVSATCRMYPVRPGADTQGQMLNSNFLDAVRVPLARVLHTT